MLAAPAFADRYAPPPWFVDATNELQARGAGCALLDDRWTLRPGQEQWVVGESCTHPLPRALHRGVRAQRGVLEPGRAGARHPGRPCERGVGVPVLAARQPGHGGPPERGELALRAHQRQPRPRRPRRPGVDRGRRTDLPDPGAVSGPAADPRACPQARAGARGDVLAHVHDPRDRHPPRVSPRARAPARAAAVRDRDGRSRSGSTVRCRATSPCAFASRRWASCATCASTRVGPAAPSSSHPPRFACMTAQPPRRNSTRREDMSAVDGEDGAHDAQLLQDWRFASKRAETDPRARRDHRHGRRHHPQPGAGAASAPDLLGVSDAGHADGARQDLDLLPRRRPGRARQRDRQGLAQR